MKLHGLLRLHPLVLTALLHSVVFLHRLSVINFHGDVLGRGHLVLRQEPLILGMLRHGRRAVRPVLLEALAGGPPCRNSRRGKPETLHTTPPVPVLAPDLLGAHGNVLVHRLLTVVPLQELRGVASKVLILVLLLRRRLFRAALVLEVVAELRTVLEVVAVPV